jgi:hypothetical protein
VMAVPKVLRALLALLSDAHAPDHEGTIRGLVQVLEGFHLDAYVPEATAAWRQHAQQLAPVDRRAARADWIAAGRLEPRRRKAGWQRLSFPHSYSADLLELLLVLGEARAGRSPAVDDGVRRLAAARRPDGMWTTAGTLNGKRHADLEPAGRPSRWVTYRALRAFKLFGALGATNAVPDPAPG